MSTISSGDELLVSLVSRYSTVVPGSLTNYSIYFLKFRVCEHGMPCVLEINSNSGLKRGHVES